MLSEILIETVADGGLVSRRGQGVASALMRAAEGLAIERGRTLLVLDTATEGGSRKRSGA